MENTLQTLKNKQNVTKKDLIDLLLVSIPKLTSYTPFLSDVVIGEYKELLDVMEHCCIKA